MKHEEPKQSKHRQTDNRKGKTHALNPQQANQGQVKLISTAQGRENKTKKGNNTT